MKELQGPLSMKEKCAAMNYQVRYTTELTSNNAVSPETYKQVTPSQKNSEWIKIITLSHEFQVHFPDVNNTF